MPLTPIDLKWDCACLSVKGFTHCRVPLLASWASSCLPVWRPLPTVTLCCGGLSSHNLAFQPDHDLVLSFQGNRKPNLKKFNVLTRGFLAPALGLWSSHVCLKGFQCPVDLGHITCGWLGNPIPPTTLVSSLGTL